jgi:hypothetical protein
VIIALELAIAALHVPADAVEDGVRRIALCKVDNGGWKVKSSRV